MVIMSVAGWDDLSRCDAASRLVEIGSPRQLPGNSVILINHPIEDEQGVDRPRLGSYEAAKWFSGNENANDE